MAKRTKARTPREARTFNAICDLPRDWVHTHDHWFSIDGGEVSIYAQRTGQSPTEKVTLPRRTFDAFVDWYNTGEWKRPR